MRKAKLSVVQNGSCYRTLFSTEQNVSAFRRGLLLLLLLFVLLSHDVQCCTVLPHDAQCWPLIV